MARHRTPSAPRGSPARAGLRSEAGGEQEGASPPQRPSVVPQALSSPPRGPRQPPPAPPRDAASTARARVLLPASQELTS